MACCGRRCRSRSIRTLCRRARERPKGHTAESWDPRTCGPLIRFINQTEPFRKRVKMDDQMDQLPVKPGNRKSVIRHFEYFESLVTDY